MLSGCVLLSRIRCLWTLRHWVYSPLLWELSFCYVGDGDPEAVLLFSLSLSALLFMRAVLLTLEVRSVFLFMDALLVKGTVLWPLRLMLSFPFLWVLSLV